MSPLGKISVLRRENAPKSEEGAPKNLDKFEGCALESCVYLDLFPDSSEFPYDHFPYDAVNQFRFSVYFHIFAIPADRSLRRAVVVLNPDPVMHFRSLYLARAGDHGTMNGHG